MPNLALRLPAYCTGCYGQYPEKTYVEFDGAFDGPVVNTDGLKQVVENVVLCEDCLRSAAKLIGLVDDEDLERHTENEREVIALRKYRAEAERRITRVQRAVA